MNMSEHNGFSIPDSTKTKRNTTGGRKEVFNTQSIIGTRKGSLVVRDVIPSPTRVVCDCDCGGVRITPLHSWRQGFAKHCSPECPEAPKARLVAVEARKASKAATVLRKAQEAATARSAAYMMQSLRWVL